MHEIFFVSLYANWRKIHIVYGQSVQLDIYLSIMLKQLESAHLHQDPRRVSPTIIHGGRPVLSTELSPLPTKTILYHHSTTPPKLRIVSESKHF